MERFENLKTSELNSLLEVADELNKKLQIEKRFYNTAKLTNKDLAFIQFICEILNNEIRAKDKAMIAQIFGGLK